MIVEPPSSTPKIVEEQTDAISPEKQGAEYSQKSTASPKLEVANNLEVRTSKSDIVEDKENTSFDN